MRKIKCYIAWIILIGICYWWFGYREMSIVEDYQTANYYENLNKENVENLDKVVRILWVASYCGNESKFLDSLKSIICEDVNNFELEKHYTRIYKLPFFIGRNSHSSFHVNEEESEDISTVWYATSSNELILTRNKRKEVIPLDCDDWNERSGPID